MVVQIVCEIQIWFQLKKENKLYYPIAFEGFGEKNWCYIINFFSSFVRF